MIWPIAEAHCSAVFRSSKISVRAGAWPSSWMLDPGLGMKLSPRSMPLLKLGCRTDDQKIKPAAQQDDHRSVDARSCSARAQSASAEPDLDGPRATAYASVFARPQLPPRLRVASCAVR